MMKNTKRNWLIVALTGIIVMVGNLGTNYVIAKRAGYKWNKKTKQMEKMCAFGIDLETEDKIAKSNMVWSVIGIIVGTVVNKTLIEKK